MGVSFDPKLVKNLIKELSDLSADGDQNQDALKLPRLSMPRLSIPRLS